MATFTPPYDVQFSAVDDATYRATSPSGEDLTRMGRRLFRHFPVGQRAPNVFLLTDGTVTTKLPPPTYDANGQVTATSTERVARTFYGGHGAYTVNATEQAALEAAGYTVDS